MLLTHIIQLNLFVSMNSENTWTLIIQHRKKRSFWNTGGFILILIVVLKCVVLIYNYFNLKLPTYPSNSESVALKGFPTPHE